MGLVSVIRKRRKGLIFGVVVGENVGSVRGLGGRSVGDISRVNAEVARGGELLVPYIIWSCSAEGPRQLDRRVASCR